MTSLAPAFPAVLLGVSEHEPASLPVPERPLLRLHGSKWRIADWVISHFPRHGLYVEPFAAGASVLLRKRPAHTEIYNDLDEELFNLFRVVRDPRTSAALAELIEATPFSRIEHAGAYELVDDPVEQARRTLVKSFMGIGSKGIWVRSGFDTRVNHDGYISRLNAFRALPKVIGDAMRRLQPVVLENIDAIALIERVAGHHDTLLYVDPPYLPSSYDGGQVYRHRYNEQQHKTLLETLLCVQAKVVLSGYSSPLYETTLEGWQRHECKALTDSSDARREVLWLNPAAASQQSFLNLGWDN